MGIRKVYLSLTVVFLVLLHGFSQEIDFSGRFTSQAAVGLWHTENSGDFLKGGMEAEGELSGNYGDSSLYIAGITEYDAAKKSGIDNFSGRVKEAYFDYNGSWFAFRIGRQISAWGAADGLIVADVLCPKDDNAFLADDTSASRLGIDAARVSLTLDSVIVDAYVIPFFTPEALPLKSTDIFHKYVFPDGVHVHKINTPDVNLKNMEYALRFSTYLRWFDLSLYGFYGFQDKPVFKIFMMDKKTGEFALDGSYVKHLMAGGDISVPLGDFTIRGEAAFFPKKCFATSTFTDWERHNEFVFLGGIDWMKSSWTITAQYFGDYIRKSLADVDEEHYKHTATLSISYSLDRANLEFSASGVVNLEDFDSAIQTEISYDFSDSINFSLGTKLFNAGRYKGTYGRYKDLSCAVLKGTYRF